MSDPLQVLSEWLVYGVLGLAKESKLGTSLDFFVYDSIKILLLLFAMIFIMGVVRSYINPERIRRTLAKKIPVLPNFIASLFGAATPFCSCSSIPIFISFLEAGVPAGAAFSFLATSPLINEYVAVLMLGFFGWKIAAAYVVVGILLGIIAGTVVSRFGMEKHLVRDISVRKKALKGHVFRSFGERLSFGYEEAKTIVWKLWPWILVGVGIGAVIHGFIPEEAINSIVSSGGVLAVPLAVLIGIPIYANCSAVVPIAVVLFQKGVPLGTALAFMMATAALSLPEAIILRRVMKLPLLAAFFGMVALGIILMGYLFNLFF
jgi:uncharacterized membrane protein YraQ (UPF0718 family)